MGLSDIKIIQAPHQNGIQASEFRANVAASGKIDLKKFKANIPHALANPESRDLKLLVDGLQLCEYVVASSQPTSDVVIG